MAPDVLSGRRGDGTSINSFQRKRTTMKMFFTALMLLATCSANAALIDFTSESIGYKANGYTVSGVQLFDTMGSELDVYDYGHQSHGNALAVNSDDQSQLKMIFSNVYSFLSLDFGNDDAGYSNAGDLAMLSLFLDGVNVGSTTVVLNRDDYMNQSISLSGINFNSAIFAYVDATFNPINLIEVVDNISFDGIQSNVPESSSFILMMMGLLGVFLTRRRIKSNA